MTGRTVYRVRPVDSLWRIELAGDSVAEYAATKGSAIERAKTLARTAPLGGVVVLDRNGSVGQEVEVDKARS